MKARPQPSPERGFALILVLGLVLLLTLLGSALYMVSQSQRFGFVAVRQQSLARQRANMGAEAALAQLRAGLIQASTLAGMPTEPSYAYATDAGAYVRSQYSDDAGVVWYQADVFNKTPTTVTTAPTLIIHSTGFNAAQNSPNLMSAVFEVEVQNPGAPPTSGYAGGH